MSRDQVLLAAIAAAAVAVFSTVMAVTGRPAMWWTVVIMILLLVVFVSRLRADRVDPLAVRLALMSGHWRADRSWRATWPVH